MGFTTASRDATTAELTLDDAEVEMFFSPPWLPRYNGVIEAGIGSLKTRGATMNKEFPSAVPEISVSNVARAAVYYERCLGFHWDWGVEGLGQVSKGGCRIFLTDDEFRGGKGTPIVIWLNLNSKAEVDELYEAWSSGGAQIVAKPESKPWNLHEFTAVDLDGNRLRVFYDCAWELPDRGGRKDDKAERDDARARA